MGVKKSKKEKLSIDLERKILKAVDHSQNQIKQHTAYDKFNLTFPAGLAGVAICTNSYAYLSQPYGSTTFANYLTQTGQTIRLLKQHIHFSFHGLTVNQPVEVEIMYVKGIPDEVTTGGELTRLATTGMNNQADVSKLQIYKYKRFLLEPLVLPAPPTTVVAPPNSVREVFISKKWKPYMNVSYSLDTVPVPLDYVMENPVFYLIRASCGDTNVTHSMEIIVHVDSWFYQKVAT